jgi:ABC-type microcin C transport system permease subunit YejE
MKKWQEWIVKFWTLMGLVLLLAWTDGCATSRVVVIPADRSVTYLKAGQSLTASNDVAVVGLALWREINEALALKMK